MPDLYNGIFGAFFYSEVKTDIVVKFGTDYNAYFLNDQVVPPNVVAFNRRKSGTYVFDLQSAVALLKRINQDRNFLSSFPGDVSIITPFLGQKLLYDGSHQDDPDFQDYFDTLLSRNVKLKDAQIDSAVDYIGNYSNSCKSYTMRPVQGSTISNVVVDFVRATNFQSITNSDAIVFLSRHTKSLWFTRVPSFSPSWFSGPFFYDDSQTINSNYKRFVLNISNNTGVTYLPDHNSDHPFKWRFFIWILEKNHAIRLGNYGRGITPPTVLEKLERLLPAVTDITRQMQYIGSDFIRYKAVTAMIDAQQIDSIDAGWFRDDEWFDRANTYLRVFNGQLIGHDVNDNYLDIYSRYPSS